MNSRSPSAYRTLAAILAAAALMTASIAPAQAADNFSRSYGAKQCHTYGIISQLTTTESGYHTHKQERNAVVKQEKFYAERATLWSGFTSMTSGYQGSNAYITDLTRMFCDR